VAALARALRTQDRRARERPVKDTQAEQAQLTLIMVRAAVGARVVLEEMALRLLAAMADLAHFHP
jgi:hypothetical protein